MFRKHPLAQAAVLGGAGPETCLVHVAQADLTILISDTITRRYYAFGGQTIAMIECTSQGCGDGLRYFLTDHIGSVIAITNTDGEPVSQQRYLPFGQVRTLSGYETIGLTDYGFTGQRDLDAQGNAFSLGLMDYRARFYDGALGRFTQPDTIIPNPANPQDYNRYSYVNNSPIVYVDPTGHETVLCDEECENHADREGALSLDEVAALYGIDFSSGWTLQTKVIVLIAVYLVGQAFAAVLNNGVTGAAAFRAVYGLNDGDTFYFEWDKNCLGLS